MAIGSACPPPPPDFGRETLALFLGRVVDDFAPGVMFPSGVLKRGLGVLS